MYVCTCVQCVRAYSYSSVHGYTYVASTEIHAIIILERYQIAWIMENATFVM